MLGNPILFGIFFRLMEALRGEGAADAWLRRASRSFPDEAFPKAVRYQPSTPLLATMYAVERRYDSTRVTARANAGEYLRSLLVQARANVIHLGGGAPRHSHWLFPVSVDDPGRLVAHARAAGFDATDGASTLVSIASDVRQCAHEMLDDAMSRVVYLPVYPEMSPRDLQRLAAVVSEATSS
jgi:dTDP-4-amino-4,6-dideoxygalactose transaminase